jgi:predicted ATP-grasp superfamily ATP-dependent carboligase
MTGGGRQRVMRVLLSEGSSTSAREAITVLGLAGHHVEICDPDPHCLGRFSRFVRRYHRCPGLGVDPLGFLSFVLELLASGRFDVLLPIHEQGLLFAKVRDRMLTHAAVALPSFDSYLRAHSKAGFSRLLTELGLAQPATHVCRNASELGRIERFPCVVKLAVGTASRGTWLVRDRADLRRVIDDLRASEDPECELLVQEFVSGIVAHAQAVFSDGRLIASHAYRQIARGAGGGDAIKESVQHERVRSDLAMIGSHLRWHGALSVDYIVEQASAMPLYIDCNPRLVEPMSACFAGVDLVDVLLRISCGEAPPAAAAGRAEVRTHIALQALLGCALRDQSRLSLLRECWRLLAKRSPYAGSREELTPVRMDWLGCVPVMATALWLLASPRAAHYLPQRGWGAHLLTPQSIRTICGLTAGRAPGP